MVKKVECCGLCFFGRAHMYVCIEIPSHLSVQNMKNYLKSLPSWEALPYAMQERCVQSP